MLLTHLSLTNFRNFARLDIAVPHGPILIVGENAQGKTSLLEAIYFLATLTSFHATHERQLINFIAASDPLAVARLVAEFQNVLAEPGIPSPKHRLEIRLIQEDSPLNGSTALRKEILLDGVKRKASEVIGVFNAVLFLPHMLRIVDGPPEERRRYLNLALSQALPDYAAYLSEYNRLLSQRNALLKRLAEKGGDPDQLTYWDEQLSAAGAYIIAARIRALQELERLSAGLHRELTRGNEVLRLAYQPSFDPVPAPMKQYELPLALPVERSGLSTEAIQTGFFSRLAQSRNDEIARGVTIIGPHRDELRLLSNGIDLGLYGSRGQGRTAVLALKLAEVAWLKQKTGQWPIVLLDEVLAELDTARRADLLTRISSGEQVMLTTTDLDLFSPDFIQSAQVWRINAGRIL